MDSKKREVILFGWGFFVRIKVDLASAFCVVQRHRKVYLSRGFPFKALSTLLLLFSSPNIQHFL